MDERPTLVKPEFTMYGGKYKGKTIDQIREVDESYILWILGQSNDGEKYEKYNANLKNAIQKSYKKRPYVLHFGKFKDRELIDIYRKEYPYYKYLADKNNVFEKIVLMSIC
jgi:uncharacterized protein (DUF3820 family)